MTDPRPFKPDFAVIVTPAAADRQAVVEVRGELDSATCEEVVAVVQNIVADGVQELTLDLREMSFIDSAGTRALIMIERASAERGVALHVTPAPEHVTELLRTAGVVDRTDATAQEPAGSPSAGKFVERTELELPRDPHSPARARLEVRECASGHVQPDELANLVLLTSELVTNAVVHPRGVGDTPIGLRVTVFEDRVRVEVEDSGEGFQHHKPVAAQAEGEAEGGRGLFIVDRFSDRWGSERVQTDSGPRFRVWFELGWQGEGAQAVA